MSRRETAGSWTAKQAKAAIFLASGASIVSAAKRSEIGERTVHTWLANPSYRAHVAELRSASLARTSGAMVRSGLKASAVLHALLEDESATTRLRAAVAVLDCMLRMRTQVDLETRLAELEHTAELRVGRPRKAH